MAKATAEAKEEAPAPRERTIIYLGNRNGIEVVPDPDKDDGTTIRKPIETGPKKRCTKIVLAPDATLIEAITSITDTARGVWQAHSDDPAPVWVAGSGPLAETLVPFLSAQYGGIEVRDPEPDLAAVGDQEG